MKTLQELDLHVPHLGVKQTCQTIGGYPEHDMKWGWGSPYPFTYSWDEGSNGDYTHNESDWGDIAPAYCYPNHSSDWDDCSGPSWSTPDSYERDDFGGMGGGDSNYDDNSGENGYYMDPSMSAKDAKIISAAMEDLPESLQHQEVKIVVDPDLLASFEPYSNACFLRKGATYTTLNGEKITITEDTILLRSAEVANKALIEESVHQWATNNGCRLNGTNTGNIDYMERQADIIEAIHYREKGLDWPDIPGDVPKDKEIMDYIDKFIENHKLNDLIDSLENSNKLRDSDTWDYKWEELLEECYPQYVSVDESPDTSSWLDLEDKYDRPIDDHVLDNHFQSGSRLLIKARR